MSTDLAVFKKREMILAIESELIAKGEGDGIVIGNSEAFPLTHSFSEGGDLPNPAECLIKYSYFSQKLAGHIKVL